MINDLLKPSDALRELWSQPALPRLRKEDIAHLTDIQKTVTLAGAQ